MTSTAADKIPPTMNSLSVRILYAESGRGLTMDAELLARVLSEFGCRVEIVTTASWSVRQTRLSHRIAGLKKRLPKGCVAWLEQQQLKVQAWGKSCVDLQIHLESPIISYIGASTTNWLIPNQEWLRPQHLNYLRNFARILVKTDEAVRKLTPFHPSVRYIGFSNPVAERLPKVAADVGRFQRFLHVAGKNRKKGTGAIVEAWRRHPEWPQLHLVVDDISPYLPLPPNIVHWLRPDRSQLNALHSACGIVLAPSEVEGYGHILVEGMAHQSIVVTTDAAPMNELVTTQRGVLTAWQHQEPCHFGTRYFVDADAIETAVLTLLAAYPEQLSVTALAAQAWVVANHQCFIKHLKTEIAQLCDARASYQTHAAHVAIPVQQSSEQESHHA